MSTEPLPQSEIMELKKLPRPKQPQPPKDSHA